MAEDPRLILHFDMDCFYAAVEVLDRPELAGLPVAVGGVSGRGVLTTCNYEARKFGCRSAMPVFEAKRLCPQLILLPVRFDRYREISNQMRATLQAASPRVEPLSLDEAFVDATGLTRDGLAFARQLKQEIQRVTGLTVSAGVGPNKLIAKIASDWRKPDGLMAIAPEEVEAFLAPLPVRRLWGVGPKAEARFAAQGIHTVADLRRLSREQLVRDWGRFGEELYEQARGRDHRPVEPDRPRRSLGVETTFDRPLHDLESGRRALRPLIRELRDTFHAKESDRTIHGVVVKVKFDDFRLTTKARRCRQPRPSDFLELLAEAWARHARPVRLLGVALRFEDEGEPDHGEAPVHQLEFWP